MSSIETYRINAVYGPGDYVSGNCCILLNGELDLNQLEIRLFGSAETEWTEQESKGSGDNQTTESVTYRDSHKYLNVSQWPANAEKLHQKMIHNGEHNIPFSFELPLSGIASSFEGQYGHIRYYVLAEIHKPGLLSINHRVKVPVNIFFPALQSTEQLSTPIAYSEEKMIGCCCSKQFVQLKASIAHTGQKVGSVSSINCTTVNRSDKNIQLRATLKQRITYKANASTKWDKKNITSVMGSTVRPGMTANESLSMPIPYDLPILYNLCPIIEINYEIVVTLVIPGSIDLHIKLPVIVTKRELPLNNT